MPAGDIVVVDGVRVRRAGPSAKARQANLVSGMFSVAIALAAAFGAVAGRSVADGVVAVVFAQMSVLTFRVRSRIGRLVEDEDVLVRVIEPLRELCARAGCAMPVVAIRSDPLRCAYVVEVKGDVILAVAAPYVRAIDDAALRALLAHEVIHVARQHPRQGREWAKSIAIAVIVVAGVVGGATSVVGVDPSFPAFIGGIALAQRLAMVAVSFEFRTWEVGADRDGALLCGDPAALSRALSAAYAMSRQVRREVLSPAVLRWFVAPVSWPLPTHPSLRSRLAMLSEMEQAARVA